MSVLTMGEDALAKEPERRARGFSGSEDRVSILEEDPVDLGLPRFKADFAAFRENSVLGGDASTMGVLMLFSTGVRAIIDSSSLSECSILSKCSTSSTSPS